MIPLVLHEIDKVALSRCEDGQTFSLWTKPHLDLIFAYEDGTIGGQGKLATLLKSENPLVVEKMGAGYELWLSLTWKGKIATLMLEEVSPAEIAANRERRREEARSTISKPIKPTKRELPAKIRVTRERSCHAGELLTFRVKPIEAYLDMQYADLEFLSDFQAVGWLHANGDVRTRVLRAYFSGYGVTARIVDTRLAACDDDVDVIVCFTTRG